MAISLLLISINFYYKEYDSITIVGLSLFMIAFSSGMGPVAWLIPSEIFFTSVRAKAMSVSTFSNRFFAAIMASTVLTAEDGIGWGSYFLGLCIVSICCFVSIFIYCTSASIIMYLLFAQRIDIYVHLPSRDKGKASGRYGALFCGNLK